MSASPSPKTVALSDAERTRVERIDQLVALGGEALPELVGMLNDSSWSVRRAVVAGLAALGDTAVPALCDVLAKKRSSETEIAAAVDALSASAGHPEAAVATLAEHRDAAVVADAAQILGRRRSAHAVPTLVRLLGHGDDNVAVAAIEALGRVGGRAAVESLVAAVNSGNFFRVFPAIDVLGRTGDPRAVGPLAKLLEQPTYAAEAARALGRTGEGAAVGPLASLLASPADALVRVAALALCELQDRFQDRLGGDGQIPEILRRDLPPGAVRRLTHCLGLADASEAVHICRILGMVGGEEAVPVLTQRLDAAPAVARAAAEALHRIGRQTDTQIARALAEGDSARRMVLLPIIARSNAAYEVAACLEDPDSEVRAQACETLARLGNIIVVPRLFPLLGDPNPRVVQAAVSAIQALGSQEARTLALEAVKSKTPSVRRAALRILAYFGDASSLEPFLAALKDDDPRIREAALQGLPYIEDKRAIEALFEAAKDPAPKTRATVMRALGQSAGDPRIEAFLLRGLQDADAWVRYYALQSLGRRGYSPAATRIAAALTDEAGQVRVAAVEALSHLEGDEAHAALKRAAASDELDVRRAALIGLGIMRRAGDLPILLGAAGDPDTATRLVALSALASFGGSDVLKALATAAADRDEQVSTAAVGLLGGRSEPEATEVLVNLLPSTEARTRVLTALAVPSSGRMPGILAALEGANDETAPLLTSVLARMQRADARAALFQALKLPNVAARKAAASTLAATARPEDFAALRDAALNDPDRGVRQICALLAAQ